VASPPASAPRAVQQEAAALAGGRLGDQEIDDDLALRRQQRAEARRAGLEPRHIGGDEPIEKAARVLAGDLDHATVGKKRCFHAKGSLEVLVETELADTPAQRKALRSGQQGRRDLKFPELTAEVP